MTVKRGGLAKSKRVRTAKASKSSTAAESAGFPSDAPEFAKSKWTPEQYQAVLASGETAEHLTDVHAMYERRRAVEGQESLLTTDTPSEQSEGPDTPPTTYGTEGASIETPGKGRGGSKPKTKKGSGKRGEKGGLYGRLAKTTGTTRKEARGVMKRARRQIRSGNKKAAARRITRALSGGPAAGVRRTPARKAAAKAAGTKIANRIQTRQRSQRSSGGGGATPRRRKK